MIEEVLKINQEQSDYILANYKTQSMKEISSVLKIPILVISEFFKQNNLESIFKCNNFSHNHYYGEISYICFKLHVESALEYNLQNKQDIFNLAILGYCFETHHDIDEAKEHFRDYFNTILAPKLDQLKNKKMIIKPEFINFLAEKTKSKGYSL